jgi:hypothetical protein
MHNNNSKDINLLGVRVMVFNATFNNISVISLWSVLLMEETRVSKENHRPAASHWKTLSHNVVSSTPCQLEDQNNLINISYLIDFFIIFVGIFI